MTSPDMQWEEFADFSVIGGSLKAIQVELRDSCVAEPLWLARKVAKVEGDRFLVRRWVAVERGLI